MNSKIKGILKTVELQLQKDEILKFKIGKTSNPESRFGQNDYENFNLATVIAKSENAKLIGQAEIDLIEYFRKHPTLKNKCENEQDGGGPDATQLYLVAQYRSAEGKVVDLFIGDGDVDNLFSSKEPLFKNDIFPIIL